MWLVATFLDNPNIQYQKEKGRKKKQPGTMADTASLPQATWLQPSGLLGPARMEAS